jgi:hypothetical protein
MASASRRPLLSHPVSHPLSEESTVLYLVIAMVACLFVAGAVLFYVAFPHRGETVPGVPWLGEVLGKAADVAPVIEDEELDLLRHG